MPVSPRHRVALALALVPLAIASCGGAATHAARSTPAGASTPAVAGTTQSGGATAVAGAATPAKAPAHASPRVRVVGHLQQAVTKAAAVRLKDGRLMVVAGLVGGASTTDVRVGKPSGPFHRAGGLPHKSHDGAAVLVGGDVIYAGGGEGNSQHADIVRIDPRTGSATTTGKLATANSDLQAVGNGTTGWTIGGYDGHSWLDLVQRLPARGNGSTTTVGHIPVGLRYSAAALLGTTTYVAGGSRADGSDTNALLAIDMATGATRVLARLPYTVAHAALLPLHGALVLVGGRVGTPQAARMLALDPATGKVIGSGTLPHGLSDPAAAGDGNTGWLAGGSIGTPASNEILEVTL